VVNSRGPALFNDTLSGFLARVDTGLWPARDPLAARRLHRKWPR
jgi:hypothetical protein